MSGGFRGLLIGLAGLLLAFGVGRWVSGCAEQRQRGPGQVQRARLQLLHVFVTDGVDPPLAQQGKLPGMPK